MSEEFGAGSLATLIKDLHDDAPILKDDWYEQFDPGKVDYKEYIKSAAWHVKAEAAKQRAGYKCQVCNGTDRLEAHHRDYSNLGHELQTDILVLCHSCHELFSKNKKLSKKQFMPF